MTYISTKDLNADENLLIHAIMKYMIGMKFNYFGGEHRK